MLHQGGDAVILTCAQYWKIHQGGRPNRFHIITVLFFEGLFNSDVSSGEYLIPEGTSLALMLYRLHRNPRIYPDPLLYNPDRFTPENSIGRHPYAYVPFSAGPRNCIGSFFPYANYPGNWLIQLCWYEGQRFAHMEVKVTATILLRKFQFKVSPLAKKPIPSFQVVLKPLNGIELIVTPRWPPVTYI